MQLWRISNYASLSGEGGLFFEGRWHTIGRPILYLAASPPGALLEVLVHLELDEDPPPQHYQLLEIAVPDDLAVENLVPDQRPDAPCSLELSTTRALGDAWLKAAKTALAQVPSAIVPSTWNYLLNPAHPSAIAIQISGIAKTAYDPRFFKMR